QLIALARALVRRSPVVILYEITSSIDFETEATIQATIPMDRVDTAARVVVHRRSVIDYDRLIILDKGKV
ncbi:hypothetical protein PAXINDRAFT_60865, partial [Paxillus involutus ATCC 200175]